MTPESEVGSIVSEHLITPTSAGLELPDDYEIAEIHAPQNCIGRTLGSIDLTNRYELRLITIRRKFAAKQKVVKSKNTSSVSRKRNGHPKPTRWSCLEHSTASSDSSKSIRDLSDNPDRACGLVPRA